MGKRRHSDHHRAEPIAPTPTADVPDTDPLNDVVAAAIADREASFTLGDALRLPPVIRATNLITSVAAQFPARLYRDNIPAPEQPQIVRRPTPFRTRNEFVSESVMALLTLGEAFWLVGDYDGDGRPHFASVLPNREVTIEWDQRRILPIYKWRGEDIDAYSTRPRLKHIAINRHPGELHGRGPINEALPYLAALQAAELYAAGWFTTGGIPSILLYMDKEDLTGKKSRELKAAWLEAHSTVQPTPAVLSGGVKAEFPGVNPSDMQLQEARDAGATIVARLVGIPPALMIVQTTGATIVYQNAAGAITELVKATIAPLYLNPIEQAWSDLVGSRAVVRFDYGELQRADVAARFSVYSTGIPLGILDAQEARGLEGWPTDTPQVSAAYQPTPQPSEIPTSVAVPA